MPMDTETKKGRGLLLYKDEGGVWKQAPDTTDPYIHGFDQGALPSRADTKGLDTDGDWA